MMNTIELTPGERARVQDLNSLAARYDREAEMASEMAATARRGSTLVLSTIIERAGGDMSLEYTLSEDCARLQVKESNA